MTKILASSSSTKAQNCKKVAQLCQREIRKVAARSVKTSKEIHARARKVNREMLLFWKRNEREERELRKKAEKEAIEKLRVEEEMREARRQARKLNFLITQTELYSHFIGKKIGSKFFSGRHSYFFFSAILFMINNWMFYEMLPFANSRSC